MLIYYDSIHVQRRRGACQHVQPSSPNHGCTPTQRREEGSWGPRSGPAQHGEHAALPAGSELALEGVGARAGRQDAVGLLSRHVAAAVLKLRGRAGARVGFWVGEREG